ncbi:MAG: AAA family ATPase [Actinobacteria bacterium]|nr:AAA family ATPase [Actinomycetota bacterium]
MPDSPLSGALLERAQELARIAGRLAEARAGEGGLTVVEGPAGIGKTSLLRAVRARAEQDGMRVLSARGSELERDFAFGVVRQALERPLSELGASERDAVMTGQAAHAGALFDPARSAVSTEALLHGLYWLLANLAEQRPLVLAIDDAHWADASSISALAFLTRRVEQLPVALIVCTRPPDVDSHATLVALIADPAAERLTPAPLGEDAVAAISASSDRAFVRAALRATGGNPFLLDQLLRELGDERSPEAVARVEPRELGRIVLARISERARAFAWALVVLGERTTPAECAALAGVDDAAGAVDELVSAGVLADDGELRFRHPLIAAAVAAGLAPARRSRWHARAARLLQRTGADAERLAMHLAVCEPAASEDVVDVLLRAADRARARGAPAAAAPLLRRALAEPPGEARRPAVLLALGDVLTVAGDPEAASVFAEAARSSDDLLVQTRALEARGWWWALAPGTARADLDEIDDLIAALPAGAASRMRLEAVRLAITCRSEPEMTRAIARAERIGLFSEDGPQHPDVLAHAALWRMLTGHSADDCAALALRATAAATGAHRAIPPSLWFPFTTSVLQAAERLTEARASAQSMQQVAREHGSATWYGLMTQSHARLLRDCGNLAEAEAEARLAVEAAAGGGGWMHALPTGTLVGVLLDRGQVAEAARAWARLGLGGEIPPARPMIDLLVVRGRLREAQGDTAGALADLAEAMRRLRGFGPASMNDQPIRLRTALLQRAGDERDGARATAAEALAIAERWSAAGAIGAAQRVRGLIEGEIELLRAATEQLASSPLRLEHAAALSDLGAALRRSGARREAREPLLAALDAARGCGADGLAAHVGDELAASGARVPARPRSGADALTPSERRIARMAAEGATNKEIAQSLFLSVKTIEMHLGHAYRKLDVRSRQALRASHAAARW